MSSESNHLALCKPMQSLVDFFESGGYKIIEKRMQDYHFHELYIKMQGKDKRMMDNVTIPDISRVQGENIFICACHWSMLEVEIK